MLLRKKGQSTLEYAVIIAVIVGALIAMQMYIKRGVQGRLRQASDDIGEQFSINASTVNITTTVTINSTEKIRPTGNYTGTGAFTTTVSNQTQNRSGSEDLGNLSEESW